MDHYFVGFTKAVSREIRFKAMWNVYSLIKTAKR